MILFVSVSVTRLISVSGQTELITSQTDSEYLSTTVCIYESHIWSVEAKISVKSLDNKPEH